MLNKKYTMKILPVIFVLDISKRMEGNHIDALNKAMNTTMYILNEMDAKGMLNYRIQINALTFADGVKWVANGMKDIEDFTWSGVEAGGAALLGAALKELNNKMCRSELDNSVEGTKLPILIFISSGSPDDDWKGALEDIKNNEWFKESIKIAIAFGERADISVLTQIVDNNSESVISVDLKLFESLIAAGRIAEHIIRRLETGDSQLDNLNDGWDDGWNW